MFLRILISSNIPSSHLGKSKSVTSNANNSSLNLGTSKSSVLVRHGGQSTLGRSDSSSTQVQVLGDGETIVIRVERANGVLDADEDAGFDEDLGAVAGVDAGGLGVEVAVEDVTSAEAERRSARVDVLPVVVGVGDVTGLKVSVWCNSTITMGYSQEALVLGAVVVGVADQRGLVVVVEVGVADGDEVGRVGAVLVSYSPKNLRLRSVYLQIGKTIVVVLAVVPVRRQIKVV